jgi:hypothetical protein
MRLHDDEDEEQLADRVLLQTWREWRRKVSREVAEAEAVAAMERCPIFGGVALRDLEREDRNTLRLVFRAFARFLTLHGH